MKTPEEYYNDIWKKKFPNITLDSDFVNEVINVSIMDAQKDAYNQAIQDVYNNRLLKDNTEFAVSFNKNLVEPILKLKI